MINRVFCYSKEVAKQNKNTGSALIVTISTIAYFAFGIVFAMALPFFSIDDQENITIRLIISIISIIGMLITLVVLCCSLLTNIQQKRSKMAGWATTTDGRIYRSRIINGYGVFISSYAAGNIADTIANNQNSIGRIAGGALGTAGYYYLQHQNIRTMEEPENVAKIIENAPHITEAETYEILKVFSITNHKKDITITCDYRDVRTGLIKYHKNILLEKSYNNLNDLINIINTHR